METSTASSNNGWQIRTLKEMLEDGSMDASDLPDPSWLDGVELISVVEAVALARLGVDSKYWYVYKGLHDFYPNGVSRHPVAEYLENHDGLPDPLTVDAMLMCWLVK